ncbi:Mannitol-1-phosphate 5-dehydrogenase [bacterium HR15]|nr:Mannitol-1-phosphate 5-dehydrogenase [bacterium HR15]
MRAIALQFGAGKIGRGLFAQLFTRAGLEVVFVEARPGLVCSLQQHRACWIEWVDGGREIIAPVRALHTDEQAAVAEACVQAVIAATAVGVNALPSVAPLLAEGLRQRADQHKLPFNILLGENDLHADQVLREALLSAQSDGSEMAALLGAVGLVRCVVGRQVVAELPGDPPGVRADRYDRLLIDADAVRGELPPIDGLLPVRPFEIYFLRKLYVHNGLHALVAYLGAQKGYTTIQQALHDPAIRALFERAAIALERALLKAFPFDAEEHHQAVAEIVARIQHPALDDPVSRVAREPLRKLRPEDRLVGAYRLLQAQGEDSEPFRQAILAALHYHDPNDPESVQLRAWIQQHGIEWVLREWCQISFA